MVKCGWKMRREREGAVSYVYDAPISLLRKPEQFNITNAENYCR
jgi:hypothetical protein